MIEQDRCQNLLLRSLPAAAFARIARLLEPAAFESDEVLTQPGEPIEQAYFLESGIATFSETFGETRIGIAHVGFDGMVGWPVLLGTDRSTHEARITASGGAALAIGTRELLAACDDCGELRDLLLRFVQVLFVQISRTVTSSLTQPVEQRLCRWTLMAHDRIEGDHIFVTHDEIAVMLSVRRATITDHLHVLEGSGLIRSERGRVLVLDRPGLLACAGEAYGQYEAEYTRLIAEFPPPER